MITEWHRYCESGNCIETRSVGDQVEIRDTERPEATLLVPAKAWEEFLASVRTGVLKTVARALLAKAKAYEEKWLPGSGEHVHWDKGVVAGMQRAAHDVANSIDRPEVRNNEGESRDA